jgi:uncharacterized glyoxalase superfamily protein PhnB
VHTLRAMNKPTVFPSLRYADAQAALDFLQAAFDAQEHNVYRTDDGRIAHAEVRFGNGAVMFGTAANGTATYGSIYVTVQDPDTLCTRARAAGAEIVRELTDTEYGSREFSAKDPEGNDWHFGTYQPFD